MMQGAQALFSAPTDIPEGSAVTLQLQRGGVFATDVAMDAALLHPHPNPPAAMVRD